MLAVARANLERAEIGNARVKLGDVMNLPVVRDSFDLVVIHQVLHFLDEPARAIAEAGARSPPAGGSSSSISRRISSSICARARRIGGSASAAPR